MVRMKEHPDRQPRCAEAVNGRNNDDRYADQELEGKGIQDKSIVNSKSLIVKRSVGGRYYYSRFTIHYLLLYGVAGSDPGAGAPINIQEI